MRRMWPGAAFLGALALSGGIGDSAPGEVPAQGKTVLVPGGDEARAQAAVERGLEYLAARQQPSGAWNNRVGYKLYEEYYGEEFESVDVTALACMALVAGGHVPGRGKYGRHVARGVAWLLSKVREEDGYITHGGSRMYSHAFATLFLAEIYGMTRQEEIKPKLKRAVNLIVNAQNREGGWRYQPIPVDADLSVTVSTLQALRAARNVGIAVPSETIDRAMDYVVRCADQRGFGFRYQLGLYSGDGRVTFALTACGIVALYSAGKYDTHLVHRALQVLPRHRLGLEEGKLHYYYGHYYAVQAMYMAGGDHWAAYFPSVRSEILAGQRTDGGWVDDVGRNYATAMALIILQMPQEYLPIFQK